MTTDCKWRRINIKWDALWCFSWGILLKSITVNHAQYSPPKTDGRETIAAAAHNCTAHMVEEDLEESNFHKWLLQSYRGLLSSQTALSLSLMLWWEWHRNIDDNYHDGCGLQYLPSALLWEMIDAAFKPKAQSNFILMKRKTSKSNETEVILHISELIIDEFHDQRSLIRCFTYTVKCAYWIYCYWYTTTRDQWLLESASSAA